MITLTESELRRLDSYIKVDEGCWEWLGGRSGKGYGYINIRGKAIRVIRLLWEQMHGEIPSCSMILHSCNNPFCVNPTHLHLGNASANMLHRSMSGHHNAAKLDATAVAAIRGLLKQGMSYKQIGKLYGVTHNAIGQIAKGTSYTWVNAEEANAV